MSFFIFFSFSLVVLSIPFLLLKKIGIYVLVLFEAFSYGEELDTYNAAR